MSIHITNINASVSLLALVFVLVLGVLAPTHTHAQGVEIIELDPPRYEYREFRELYRGLRVLEQGVRRLDRFDRVTKEFDFLMGITNDIVINRSLNAKMTGENFIVLTGNRGRRENVRIAQHGFPAGVRVSGRGCRPTCEVANKLTADISTPVGEYPIEVVATGDGLVRRAQYQLIITDDFAYDVSNSGDVRVMLPKRGEARGQNVITVSLIAGENRPVTFSVQGLPQGAESDLTECEMPCSASQTISVPAGTSPGKYLIATSARAEGSDTTLSTNFVLEVVGYEQVQRPVVQESRQQSRGESSWFGELFARIARLF